MEYIKNKFYQVASKQVAEYMNLKKRHSDVVIGKVTIGDVMSGMKGIPSLITDTSKLDAQEGIRYRGMSIPELQQKLPCLCGEQEPLPEGLFYLLLIGEVPKMDDVKNISKDWAIRSNVPQHVFDVIEALPKSAKPMAQFSTAILSMATESFFQNAHRVGVHKKYYWDTIYEDVMNLIARLPRVAAYIYRRIYHNDNHIDPDPRLDWAGNLAHMMGHSSNEVKRMLRLYMLIHADHEGGNITAHTAHLVGSGLSNPYYAYAAAMLGLAGPLHGYANQDTINWIFDMIDELGTDEPEEKDIVKFCRKTLREGRVIPGYGHAVLQKTDPRFAVQKDFADKFIKNDKLIDIVNTLYKVVPGILQATGKVRNPWPNVDAYSGALLSHYGIKEHTFYTVLFGVSRSLGVLAAMIHDRVYGFPIERPTSYPLQWYKDLAEGQIQPKS